MVGALVLSAINNWLLPRVLHDLPSKVGLDFDLSEISAGIYGFLLVLLMLVRPEGLLPERRHRMALELQELIDWAGEGGGSPPGPAPRSPDRTLFGGDPAAVSTMPT